MTEQLKKAIELFEDENSKQSVSDRFALLRSAFMAESFSMLKKQSEENVSDEELGKHEKLLEWFLQMEKIYSSGLRFSKLENRSQRDIDEGFMSEIRKMKSTLGEIKVRTQEITE